MFRAKSAGIMDVVTETMGNAMLRREVSGSRESPIAEQAARDRAAGLSVMETYFAARLPTPANGGLWLR